jgi:hypothetical protein
MRTAIASILAVTALVGLAGCESNAQPGNRSILGYQVDEARNRSLWLTREGVLVHSAAAQPRLVALPGWVYAGAPSCPPHLAIGPGGEVVVTSNVLPTLWRIDPETLAVTVHPLALDADNDKDVGFAAIVHSPGPKSFIAYSSEQRSLWRIASDLKSAARIAKVDLREARRTRGARGTPCADLNRRLSLLEP